MIGLRELLLIGMVVLVLYGRSGVLKGSRAQKVLPWLSPVRRTTARQGASARAGEATSTAPRLTSKVPGAFLLRGDRLYWFLTILAATAIAAWVITRTLITSGSAPLPR
jgi:hypothetical protein